MNIPLDVLKIVASYLVKPKMKLLDWVLLDKINWCYLSKNPNAIHLLESVILDMDNPLVAIDWKYLSANPNIFEIDTKQLKLDIAEQAKIIDDIIYE